MSLYIHDNETVSGPYTVEDILRLVANMEVSDHTQVWQDESDEWVPLREFMGQLSSEHPIRQAMAMKNPDLAISPVLADPMLRLSAAFVDLLVGLSAFLPLVLVTSIYTGPPGENTLFPFVVWLTVLLILGIIVLQSWYIAKRGQSLGKMAVKIKIVNEENNENPGFVTAVVLRWWVTVALTSVPNVGWVYGTINLLFILGKDRRCIHDYMAGTKVIVDSPSSCVHCGREIRANHTLVGSQAKCPACGRTVIEPKFSSYPESHFDHGPDTTFGIKRQV